MSHLHFDHAGGLLRADGSKAFPARPDRRPAGRVGDRARRQQPHRRVVRPAGAAARPRVGRRGRGRRRGRAPPGRLGRHDRRALEGAPGDRRPAGRGGTTLAFFGDLGMRPWSANPRWVTSFDDFPLDSVEVKGELFARAAERGLARRAQPRAGHADRPADARSRPLPLRPDLTSGARLSACSGWRSGTATTSTSMPRSRPSSSNARRRSPAPLRGPGSSMAAWEADHRVDRRRRAGALPRDRARGVHDGRRDVVGPWLPGGLDRPDPVRIRHRRDHRGPRGSASDRMRGRPRRPRSTRRAQRRRSSPACASPCRRSASVRPTRSSTDCARRSGTTFRSSVAARRTRILPRTRRTESAARSRATSSPRARSRSCSSPARWTSRSASRRAGAASGSEPP